MLTLAAHLVLASCSLNSACKLLTQCLLEPSHAHCEPDIYFTSL